MAPAAKGNNATPGRRKRTDNQYFDIGKVGRKTGITLKDSGIRDEHGLEPVSGIFSSPTSPEQNGDRTLTSEGMDMQESSAPEVSATLTGRKTPRFPPPRQSTPRHTNIGSPKRMSSVKQSHQVPDEDNDYQSPESQPRVNRKLEYGASNRNRKSIAVLDTQSPFKPKNVLRRSNGPARPDPYTIPAEDDEHSAVRTTNEYTERVDGEDDDIEQSIEYDDGPIMLDDDGHYLAEPYHTGDEPEETHDAPASDSPLKRKRGRPRKSDQSSTNSQVQLSPHVASGSSSSKRRDRPSLASEAVDESSTSIANGTMGPPPKKKRTSNANKVIVLRDDEAELIDQSGVAYGDEYTIDDGAAVPPQDSELAAQLDSQLEVTDSEVPERKGKGRSKGKRGKATVAPKERDPNRAMSKATGSPVKLSDSPSKRYRGGSSGPVSNVNLRAATPFDDANQQTSRFGRNLIQPLKYWENEARIWKGGEIEGIVRAEHVEKPKLKNNKKRQRGRKAAAGRLQDIEEESETESTMADEWEEAVGVISGTIANWNGNSEATKTGDPDDPITEDLAFAASSIVTRDVAGSDFKYAKIMTMPFFGAGVVELPPEGYKRAKNSRKMQMVFFVHDGKVLVEVGATGMEINSFALSKGGVWVVPRGNNYAITNESRTKAAKVFFAQGCEVTTNAE